MSTIVERRRLRQLEEARWTSHLQDRVRETHNRARLVCEASFPDGGYTASPERFQYTPEQCKMKRRRRPTRQISRPVHLSTVLDTAFEAALGRLPTNEQAAHRDGRARQVPMLLALTTSHPQRMINGYLQVSCALDCLGPFLSNTSPSIPSLYSEPLSRADHLVRAWKDGVITLNSATLHRATFFLIKAAREAVQYHDSTSVHLQRMQR